MTPDRLAELKARATRPRRTVPIVLNGDLRQRVQDLDDELDRLEAGPTLGGEDRRLASTKRTKAANPRVAEIEAELAELHAQAEQDTLHVVLEGLAGTPWRALLAEHPVRRGEDGKDLPADARFGGNLETIRKPAIRACIIGHRAGDEVQPLDDEFVEWLLDWVTDAQEDLLWLGALAASRGDDAVPLPRTRSTTATSDSA